MTERNEVMRERIEQAGEVFARLDASKEETLRLARVGLMALVDEATGYQKERGKRWLRDTYERLGKG